MKVGADKPTTQIFEHCTALIQAVLITCIKSLYTQVSMAKQLTFHE